MSSIYIKGRSCFTTLTWPEWKYRQETRILSQMTRHGEAVEYIMGLIAKQADLEALIEKKEKDRNNFCGQFELAALQEEG